MIASPERESAEASKQQMPGWVRRRAVGRARHDWRGGRGDRSQSPVHWTVPSPDTAGSSAAGISGPLGYDRRERRACPSVPAVVQIDVRLLMPALPASGARPARADPCPVQANKLVVGLEPERNAHPCLAGASERLAFEVAAPLLPFSAKHFATSLFHSSGFQRGAELSHPTFRSGASCARLRVGRRPERRVGCVPSSRTSPSSSLPHTARAFALQGAVRHDAARAQLVDSTARFA